MRNLIRFAPRAGAFVLAFAVLTSTDFFAFCQNASTAPAAAGQQQPIALPAPQTSGGMPLMQALQNRKTTRAFRDQSLSMQTLSNLLWAAFGVNRKTMPQNRPPGPGRPGGPGGPNPPGGSNGPGGPGSPISPTVPGGANAPGGPNRPGGPGGPGGLPRTGRTAPSAMNSHDIELYVVLADGIYLYDAEQNQLKPVAAGDMRSKIGAAPAAHAAVTLVYAGPAKDDQYAQVDTGFIGQNVYLFAVSEGLNAWFYAVHGQQEAAAIAALLQLGPDKLPLYGQSVGYPPQ